MWVPADTVHRPSSVICPPQEALVAGGVPTVSSPINSRGLFAKDAPQTTVDAAVP